MSKEKLIGRWTSENMIKDKRVINAFSKIPREIFLQERKDEAYSDHALPIGEGQTISQPTTVLIMTEALEIKENDKILEIGSGSGYQSAILSQIATRGKIISVEIIKNLADLAKSNIIELGIKNVEIIHGDGSIGYAKEAPYDKILITAAAPKIPNLLVSQLKEGGIIVAPVGDANEQIMIRAIKKNGRLIEEKLGHFVFVPLRGKHGF